MQEDGFLCEILALHALLRDARTANRGGISAHLLSFFKELQREREGDTGEGEVRGVGGRNHPLLCRRSLCPPNDAGKDAEVLLQPG